MAEKKVEKVEEKKVDLLDVLLDKDNKEPIVLMDEKGRKLSFEQVAIIPFEISAEEKNLYCVLKPIDTIEGIADDEAIVFMVDEDPDGNTVLRVEENEERAIAVFDKYYDLLEEAQAAKKATKKPAAKKEEAKVAAKKTAGKTAGKTVKK